MAEAVVSVALETFRDLLLEKARFLSGVGGEVKELETQLKEVRCFLEDADKRRHESKTIFNYIVEIRDLAYRAESAIELYAARVYSRRRRGGLRDLIARCSCILTEGHSLHQLGSEIEKIKPRLESVTQKLIDSGIHRDGGESSSAANDNQKWSRKTYPDFEVGDCFVGMEDKLKQLEFLLMEDKAHRVISVWGMGGSGKTTIAKKLYNSIKETGTDCFDSFAWVCISQQCQIQSVLKDTLRQLKPQKNENDSTSLSQLRPQKSEMRPQKSEMRPQKSEMRPQKSEDVSTNDLMEQLKQIQRERRCLIVVDDLWETSHWNGFKHAFLVQDLQSKILVTTRVQRVAEIGFPVELGLLSIDDALELLKKKAFSDPHTDISDHEENFNKIGREMVRKCGYLPLAISLLGGVLSKKTSLMDWEYVNENINTLMYRGDGDDKNESEIDGVLNLSYESLPHYLKPCFLCLGILKEDEGIVVENLYAKWIAQGLIAFESIRYNDETSRDTAERYLSELASRSIVQVHTHGGFYTSKSKYSKCSLHDVIRELCLEMGKKEDFGILSLEYEGGKFSTLLSRGASNLGIKIRHLAIHVKREVEPEHDELTVPSGENSSKHLRSLQIFGHGKLDAIEFPPRNIVDFQKFKLLRELVFVRFRFAGRKLPKGITNLVHLRCLRLEICELDRLPSSIRNLVYLDTLDLTWSENVKVPNVFQNMIRLRYLILPHYDDKNIGKYRLRVDEGLDELESLMYLDSRVHDLRCMGKMPNLQQLTAAIYDNESLLAILNGIATKWNKLVRCVVSICDGCELGTSEEGLLKKAFTCPNLHMLVITVKLGKMLAECGRDFMSSKLTTLSLSGSEIEDDPMGILAKLPCLKYLSLDSSSFVGEEMTCPSLSFSQLEKLELKNLPNLKEWRVEAGAMPLLSELEILACPRLEMLPDGLSGISTLKKLEITGMPELGERVSKSGEDFHKVRHVPSIIIIN